MPRFSLTRTLTALSALTMLPLTHAYAAGSNGGWFVPKTQQAPAAPPRHAAPVAAPEPEPMDDDGSGGDGGPVDNGAGGQNPPPVFPLPPVPAAPAIAKEAPPPAAAIGIISVQGVMQLSTAAQEIQQVLGARRDRLAHEVQKEEAAWRGEQQKLQMQARSLTSDQLQLRVRHLQERRAKDQHVFGNQARIIQEAYQVAFHQIERVLEQHDGIVSRVAAARGMNLILHAEQAVLHVDGQDITEEVASHLNQVLPHVFIPDDGADPEELARSGKMATTADEESMMRQAASAPQQSGTSAQPQASTSVLRRH
ncbi:OmpH family outer membrane protein [Saccharibacter sp. EH611]|uniref:OmpH family outer membrane protein n=1 Tax=Saccharibacter sp. EH611 TaxID=2689391 RepID=UPI001325601C|nr:OmpH family outer membrane protein [Saccharibacter sp. EH611]MXV36147.1 OmpH family outer membrane protein [Saccharibacter sp. EH611]